MIIDPMTVECGCVLSAGEDIVFLATDINLAGAVDWVMMQTCFGHHFMLVLEKQERSEGTQMFYTVVQLVGTRKQAENFVYKLVGSELQFLLKFQICILIEVLTDYSTSHMNSGNYFPVQD